MGGDPIQKIAAMLRAEALEKRMAAAIVLGELEARGPAVVAALTASLDDPVPALQRHALEALGRLKARKALPLMMPLVGAREDDVRAAAVQAIAALGDDVIDAVRERLATAEPRERRALEEILARLGGKAAFSALLDGIDSDDVEAAKAAALAVRQRVKDAGVAERRAYLAEVKKFLGLKRTQRSPAARAAGLKIMGYLHEPTAVPVLLGYATSKKQPDPVRQEALIALRFVTDPRAERTVAGRLLALADSAPPPVALAALYTLGGFALGPSAVRPLVRLCAHPDGERARLALERLGQMKGREASRALREVLLVTKDRARAEIAAAAVAAREDAAPSLAGALLQATDADRIGMLARALRPLARNLDRKGVKTLLDAAGKRMVAGKPGWEAPLQIAREADSATTAAALRGLALRLRKARKTDRALEVLRILGRTELASNDDLFALAAMTLARGRRDLHPGAREQDEALRIIGVLLDRGFDVAAAMRKDRSLDLDHRYYVGFHAIEKGSPLGEELLSDVARAGGRTAVARMARSKLKSAGVEI